MLTSPESCQPSLFLSARRKCLLAVGLTIAAMLSPTLSVAAKLAVVTNRMPEAEQNAHYDFKIYASGGIAPYRWSVSGLAGSGLSASQAGVISGTPKNVRSYQLGVTVQDSSVPPLKAQGALLLTIYSEGFAGATGPSLFGLHTHNATSDWPPVSSATNPFGVVRMWDTNTSRYEVETSQGVFDWTNMDQYVRVAQANGVRVLYEVGQTPPWASSDPSDRLCRNIPGSCDAPADWDTFDDFMTAVVSRYTSTGVQVGCPGTQPQCHGVINIYELWNEPFNPAMWRPKQKKYNYDARQTMEGFVRMTQDAQRIIKRIDPNALVSSPSGAPAFMTQYWNAPGALTDFDQIAVHAYPMPSHPVPESMVYPTMIMRRLMTSNHVTSPLVNTEGSWGLFPPPSDSAQAAYAARYILLQVATQIKEMMWYLWSGLAPLWKSDVLTPAGVGYQQVAIWLLGTNLKSTGCLDSSGTFQPDIYKCTKLDGTYVVNLVRPNNYEGQAVWFVKTTRSGVDWTATSTYYVPQGFTHYRDLNGQIHHLGSQVTIGASPILLETKSIP